MEHICKATRLSTDVVRFVCTFPGCKYYREVDFKTGKSKTNAKKSDKAHSEKEMRVLIEPQEPR